MLVKMDAVKKESNKFSLFLYPSQINCSSFDYIISCPTQKRICISEANTEKTSVTGQMQNCISQPLFMPMLSVYSLMLFMQRSADFQELLFKVTCRVLNIAL